MARYAQSRVDTIDVPSENWDDKVSEFVRLLMPDGLCTVERVAEHLGCNRRTMHRHLFENGTSFSGILDAERAALATRLIEDGNRPLAGIAELLGFSAQSAIRALVSRAFWMQHNPMAQRHPAAGVDHGE